jgi:hypothetical protein
MMCQPSSSRYLLNSIPCLFSLYLPPPSSCTSPVLTVIHTDTFLLCHAWCHQSTCAAGLCIIEVPTCTHSSTSRRVGDSSPIISSIMMHTSSPMMLNTQSKCMRSCIHTDSSGLRSMVVEADTKLGAPVPAAS